jgi:hypothetical protein
MGQRNRSCEPGGGWNGSTCKRKRLSASRAVDTIRWPMRGTAVQSRTGMRDMICAYNVDISLDRSRSQRVGSSRSHELIHAEATGTKPYPPAWTSHTPSDGERKGINLVWEGGLAKRAHHSSGNPRQICWSIESPLTRLQPWWNNQVFSLASIWLRRSQSIGEQGRRLFPRLKQSANPVIF